MKKLTLFLAIFITKLAIAAGGIGVVALKHDKSRNMNKEEYRELIKSYTIPNFIVRDNTLLYNTSILDAGIRKQIVDGTRQFLIARFNAIHAAKGVSTVVTIDNLDYYLSLCEVRKNFGSSKWSLISKTDWSSQINEFGRDSYFNEDSLYYLGEKVASLKCGNVNQDPIVSSSSKYEESMKGSTPPPPATIASGSVPPPPTTTQVASGSGSIPPPPASMTTTSCPPPTPKCGDCTASNSSKDKDDEQTKILKSINQKVTWGLIIGGLDLLIDGFHLVWDMTRGEYVASNGGGINPPKQQGGLQNPPTVTGDQSVAGGGPNSFGGDTQ